MTLPYERRNAVQRTEQFLLSLCDPAITPRVPRQIREQAKGLLKHYPSGYHMAEASKQLPELFGSFESTWNAAVEKNRV